MLRIRFLRRQLLFFPFSLAFSAKKESEDKKARRRQEMAS
jgi:hypothetical protein